MNIKESCKCPACSSSLVFDIVTYSLRCPGCDALYDLEKFGEDRLTKHPPRNAGKDAAPDPEVRHCTNCGAGLYPGAQSLTAACPCCKRPVRGASRSADGIMPDLVIPFSYGREDFLKAFRESCGEDPTVKDGFRLDILPESVRPVYLPFLVYDLKGTAEISVIFKDSDGVRFDRSKNFDLDLTAFPELLHDIPVKDFSKKNPIDDSWYDEWALIDDRPFSSVWFCGLRDKYGTVSPPEILDPGKTPDFRGVKDRILNMCVRSLVKEEKLCGIPNWSISLTPGSIRYVLYPAWLLPVTYRGKTYFSVMNASNRSNITLSVPRSWFKRVVIALAFGAYGTGLFTLASIPVTMPVPPAPAPYSWIIIPIYVLYLPLLALMCILGVKSYGFCCRRLFKGMFSVLLTSLALILAGILMIYAFFAVYDGSNAQEWAAALIPIFSLLSQFISFCLTPSKHT